MENNEHNEMNLFDLICWCCRGIGRFFKWCGVQFLHLFRFSVQNWWLILIFVVIFGVIGFLKIRPESTAYYGGATVFFYQEEDALIDAHIGRINSCNRSKELRACLNLPDSLQDKIGKIEAFRWIDCQHNGTADFVDFDNQKKYLTDTTDVPMTDRIYLRVKTKGVYDMSGVQQWLQDYFNQRHELTALSEQGRQVLRARLETCNREIARLDSLSNYEYFSGAENNRVEVKDGLLLNKGKQLYYNDILNLIDERGKAETAINSRPNNINFQNDLIVKPVHGRLVTLLIWLILGYAVGVAVSLCVVYRRQICNYLKK